eukprot:TRINITY_DN61982_c0_g1_i1.p2 TRINITY_DN61982_c0_g1~~TRINITY_DN61982_c0_g1_i1.p2  ORF type:complete len:410 (+),score=66.48 TRINITY_DN61982_c0_g1_i1:76-1305(+)
MPTNATVKAMQEEKRMLEELATVNQMTIRKLENERDSNRTVLPEDSLDTIVRLENTLKLERQNTEKLVKENKLLDTQLKKQEKAITKVVGDLEDVKRETGWVKGMSMKKEEKEARANENKIAELQLMLQKLEEEQRTNKLIQRKKTQLIETLSKELDNKKQLEEELFTAQNTIKVKEREIKDCQDELKTLQKIHAKKDKLIVSMEHEKDNNHLKQLEGDKRFLQSEIAKHTDRRRLQERTVKSQQIRIDQLQARIESITQALRDLKLDRHLQEVLRGPLPPVGDVPDVLEMDPNDIVPEHEPIDMAIFDLLQRDLDALRNQLSLKDVIIQEKDANMEALERKVEILAHSKRSEAKSIHAERKEAVYQMDDLKRTLDMQHGIFKKQSEKLKIDNARLRKQCRQTASPQLA